VGKAKSKKNKPEEELAFGSFWALPVLSLPVAVLHRPFASKKRPTATVIIVFALSGTSGLRTLQ